MQYNLSLVFRSIGSLSQQDAQSLLIADSCYFTLYPESLQNKSISVNQSVTQLVCY